VDDFDYEAGPSQGPWSSCVVQSGEPVRFLRSSTVETVRRAPGRWFVGLETNRLLPRRPLPETWCAWARDAPPAARLPRARGAARAGDLALALGTGQALICDWRWAGTVETPAGPRPPSFFCSVLGYSRRRQLTFSCSERFPALAVRLVSNVEQLGGVPRKVLLDNPRTGRCEKSSAPPCSTRSWCGWPPATASGRQATQRLR
jgi:hypothetical protein